MRDDNWKYTTSAIVFAFKRSVYSYRMFILYSKHFYKITPHKHIGRSICVCINITRIRFDKIDIELLSDINVIENVYRELLTHQPN